MEMIKGIQGHGYYDELVVPIIENTAHERELTDALAEAVCPLSLSLSFHDVCIFCVDTLRFDLEHSITHDVVKGVIKRFKNGRCMVHNLYMCKMIACFHV